MPTHSHEPVSSSFMNTLEISVFLVSILVCSLWIQDEPPVPLYTHTHLHTPLPAVLHFIHSSQINSGTTLFMIPNLCQQSGRPPPSAASPLISSASCLCLPLHVRSMKQWYFLVTSNDFVRFLKGEEDKWREGRRGCEDNGFLWWLTFQSGASKKVWLSYCVFTDSQMNGGLGTGFVCGTEGNKHTMSNLHLCVWASPQVSEWTESDTFILFFWEQTLVYTIQPAEWWVSSSPLRQWVSRLSD